MQIIEQSRIDLNGEWYFALDPESEQNWHQNKSNLPEAKIQIPGSIE